MRQLSFREARVMINSLSTDILLVDVTGTYALENLIGLITGNMTELGHVLPRALPPPSELLPRLTRLHCLQYT